MDNFPNNSFAAREAKPITNQNVQQPAKSAPVQPVVNAKPTVAKKSGFKKVVSDIFVPEDVNDVKEFLWKKVAVPSFKNFMWDTLGFLIGDRPNRSYSNGPSTPTRTPYSNMYTSNSSRPAQSGTPVRTNFEYNDIGYVNRGDSEFLLNMAHEYVNEYRVMSVAQFYGMAGLSASEIPWTANDWGWRDITGAHIAESGGQFVIRMPRPIPIK